MRVLNGGDWRGGSAIYLDNRCPTDHFIRVKAECMSVVRSFLLEELSNGGG